MASLLVLASILAGCTRTTVPHSGSAEALLDPSAECVAQPAETIGASSRRADESIESLVPPDSETTVTIAVDPVPRWMPHPLCEWGLPIVTSGGIELEVVEREGYALGHSPEHKIAFWVLERLTAAQLKGSAGRNDNFYPDPALAPGRRAELSDYRGSGFDRGHLAPAADFKSSQQMNDESFSLANVVPQVGAGFNRTIWAKLEDIARREARRQDSELLYIVTGAMLYDPEDDDPATDDGRVPFRSVGANAVTVPTHMYKIAVTRRTDGTFCTFSVAMENRAYTARDRLGEYECSIAWIEERTGLNFFPALDDEIALKQEIELTVDTCDALPN